MLKEIIKGCRKRQRESQKKLYEMYYAYGMSITLRYADSHEQGVTILNDAFMKVFDNINRFDTDRPFNPWFRKIVINTAINQYHKDKKRREINELQLVESRLASEEKILSGISYREIVEMVQQLTPAYRAVFNLFAIEGFTHEEISKMLGISVGTSKSNLSKAKRNLRVILERNLNFTERDVRSK